LTSYKKDLSGGDDWLSALAGPATNKDKLYAVPLSASSQGIIYNKNMWQAAGVTSVPKTWAELTAALDKVKASNTAADFSPLYLAGGNWYNALSWVYDFGGTLATENGGKWKAGFSSPESIAGLEAFKEFQNSYSTPSSRSALYDQPLAYEVLSTEKTSAVMAWMYNSNAVIENNPALKDVLGSFALPSMTKSGETAPIFLGGSDIAIPAKSKNQELAIKYLKIFTSHDFQLNELVKRGQQIPISTQLIDEVVPTLTDFEKPFYAAAGNSLSTPATAGWVTIESDNSAQDFFIKVASGSGTIPDAAAAFDKHLDQALNATDK
jgi:N,N'-diacetylchitobiose transport system substrate-binding protein